MPRPAKPGASSLHKSVYDHLREIFPCFTIVQEYAIKTGKQTLFIDILIKELSIAFECQGQQHYQYTEVFHGDRKGFEKSKARDKDKRTWCEMNGITLIEIPYYEKVTESYIRKKVSEVL